MRKWINEIIIVVSVIGILIVLTGVIRDSLPKVEPYEIWDKCENNGRYFVEVWVEVTPEEYIGLDIGDEYEVKQ